MAANRERNWQPRSRDCAIWCEGRPWQGRALLVPGKLTSSHSTARDGLKEVLRQARDHGAKWPALSAATGLLAPRTHQLSPDLLSVAMGWIDSESPFDAVARFFPFA